jgi:GGDEF domain-containing protein
MFNASTGTKLRAVPAVATLVGDGAAVTPLVSWVEGPRFPDAQQLITSGFAADVVLLIPGDARQATTWLEALRRDARIGLAPILLARSFGESIDALSDGVAAGAETIVHHASAFAARSRAICRSEPDEADDRLLMFLYLRPDYVLTPIADWRDERIYRYPLADVLGRGGEDGFLLLDRLRRRGLLEPTGLHERVHTCAACGAGHLLFIETCPQCGGIDTAEQNFLHCYACGNVATQEAYLTHDGLSCPKCSVRLRHLGVDYDRALETLACRGCGGRFTEPDVKARCLRCRKLSATDELAERNFYSLRLSAAGELAARTGHVGDLFKLMDEFSQAHPDYFAQTLDWLLNLHRRHDEVRFGLVFLKFTNVQLLAARLPRHRVAQMFDALAQRLRALIRTTDMFMRDDEAHCWLLLPQTAKEGMDVLLGRIAALSEASTQSDGLRIEIETASVTSGEVDEHITNARMLMGVLRNRSA